MLQLLPGVLHRLLDGLLGGFQELLLLELKLLLDLLPLDVGNQEGANEILDKDLGLVLLELNLVEVLVESLGLQLGLLEGLHTR